MENLTVKKGGIWGLGKEQWKPAVVFKREYYKDRNWTVFKNELIHFDLGFSYPNHVHTLLSNCKKWPWCANEVFTV